MKRSFCDIKHQLDLNRSNDEIKSEINWLLNRNIYH